MPPSIPAPDFGPSMMDTPIRPQHGVLARDSTSSGSINEAIAVKETQISVQGSKEKARRSWLGQTKQGKIQAKDQSEITTPPGGPGDESPMRAAGQSRNTAAPSRPKTFFRAAHKLYALDEAQVSAFMDSYVIYGLDWKDESAMREALGDNFQQRVGDCLKAYYSILNHLCALGDTEKMYIPPLMDRALSVRGNQLRYEETIADDLCLKAGDRVLDLGCGRGRVAAHMASYVEGTHVTGLNIDADQLAQARSFNGEELGLPNDFVEYDFNNLPLPFADGTFDAFYEIQALSLCRDHRALFADLFRVLKPGARFSLLDWVSLPAYDATNPEHSDLMRRVKPLIGAVGTPTPDSLATDLRDAGFEVVRSDNASLDGLQAPLIDRVDIYFRSLRRLVLGLVKMRLLPPHLKTLINRLCLDGQAFVKMDEMRLATTTYRIIAVKPAVAVTVSEVEDSAQA